jgi:cytidine deaminase
MNRFDMLEALLERSFAPYSGFHVASVVVTKSGEIFKGVNVESVAYPTTICAERNAIFSAVTAGVKAGEIAEVHILARDAQKRLTEAFPCGSCRQVIAEQSLNGADVFVYRSRTEVSRHTIASLLPHAFFSLTQM